MTPRSEVYKALDGERDYQKKWQKCESEGMHELAAYILFMEDYLAEARNQITRGADELSGSKVLVSIRKVTALGVAAMEQHGAPLR